MPRTLTAGRPFNAAIVAMRVWPSGLQLEGATAAMARERPKLPAHVLKLQFRSEMVHRLLQLCAAFAVGAQREVRGTS